MAVSLAKDNLVDVVENDVLEFLEGETRLFDCVVVDPPPWGTAQTGLTSALAKYQKISSFSRFSSLVVVVLCSYCAYIRYRRVFDAAAQRVAPGGMLLLNATGRSVTRKQFEKLVRETGASRYYFQLLTLSFFEIAPFCSNLKLLICFRQAASPNPRVHVQRPGGFPDAPAPAHVAPRTLRRATIP